MAAFSVFFMQSPSFLAHQQRLRDGHGRSNAESLFGLSRIPSDNHIRAMLDPAEPALLYPAFGAALTELERSGGLNAFRRLGGRTLIALDGTEYFRSNKIHRSYREVCRYGPIPAAPMIQASGADAAPSLSIVRRQLR